MSASRKLQPGEEIVTDPAVIARYHALNNKSQEPEEEVVTDPEIISRIGALHNKSQSPDEKILGDTLKPFKHAGHVMWEDIKQLPGAMVNATMKGLNAAPGEIGGYEKQMFTDPKRFAKNFGTGIGSAAQGIINTPSNILKYAGHLGLVNTETANMIPQQPNYLQGLAPEGQQAGDTLIQGTPGMMASAIPFAGQLSKAGGAIEGGLQYLRPGKTANEFMENLSGGRQHVSDFGGLKTAEQNLTETAKRLSFARNSAAEEALNHKRPVFAALGEKQIAPMGKVEMSNGKAPGKNYKVVSNARKTDYFTKSDAYEGFTGDLKDYHKEFMRNPTLNNADALQQQIGSRIGDLNRASSKAPLDAAEAAEQKSLIKARDNLMADQDKFMTSQDPMHKLQYDLFRTKWRNNVNPYDEHPILSQITRKGMTQGITPSETKSIFEYPTEKVQKIIQDIGPSGKQNILYNELQSEKPKGAKQISEDLAKARQFGYEKYFTPELKMLGEELGKRGAYSDIAKDVGLGALGYLGGGFFGHPYIGLAAGAALRHGSQAATKILEKIKK